MAEFLGLLVLVGFAYFAWTIVRDPYGKPKAGGGKPSEGSSPDKH